MARKQQTNKPTTQAPTQTAPTEVAQATGETYGVCRVIVRGRLETGGPILRAVRTVEAPGADVAEVMSNAYLLGDTGMFADMAKARGFVEVTTRTIYPPVGLLCRGGVSKGNGVLPDGTVVWCGRDHKAGAPAPAHIVALYMGKATAE